MTPCSAWWRHQTEYFPRYLPFVRGIYRSPVDSNHKGWWRGALIFFFDQRLNKRLSDQSGPRRFETPSRSFWRHCNGQRSALTLDHLMACLTASSHYMNQCWFLINEVLWNSAESNFTASAPAIILYDEFDNYTFKILPHLPGANELKQHYRWICSGNISICQYSISSIWKSFPHRYDWLWYCHIKSLTAELCVYHFKFRQRTSN